MVNLDDVIILIKWRDETKEKKKARAIQKVIDKLVNKIDKRGVTYSNGGFSVSQYAIFEMKCHIQGLKITG